MWDFLSYLSVDHFRIGGKVFLTYEFLGCFRVSKQSGVSIEAVWILNTRIPIPDFLGARPRFLNSSHLQVQIDTEDSNFYVLVT